MAGEDTYIEGVPPTEVAPPQPRDRGGRFAEVQSAPEPMFGLRPVEGDPETGDMSDGGDDPALRSQERKARGQNEQRVRQRQNVRRDRRG